MDQYSHWRNSQRPGRFFMFDARASLAFLFVLLHFRLWTLIVAGTITTLFWLLEQRGLTFEAAFRAARAYLVGGKRPATSFTIRRTLLDLSPTEILPWPEKAVKPAKPKKNAKSAAQPADMPVRPSKIPARQKERV